MGWLRKLRDSAAKNESLVSWGERVGQFLWWVLGGPALFGIFLGGLAWISQNLLYGALFGLTAWVLTQIGFTVWGFRRATVNARSSGFDQAREELDTLKEEIRDLRANAGNALVPAVIEEDMTPKLQRLEEANARLEAENKTLREHPDDEHLQPRCVQFSESLFEFAEKRDREDPRKSEQNAGIIKGSQARNDYDDETRAQYARHFGPEAGALLDAVERRGWLSPEERRTLESTIKSTFRSPTKRLRELAQRIGAFGKRL